MLLTKAMPVWIKGKETLLNGACVFFVRFKKYDNVELRITASNFYKAYLNGKLVSFGPSRAAHNYFRVDRVALENLQEQNTLYIEVVGYNTLNYWAINQAAFLQAEIVSDGNPFAWSGEHFYVREYSEKIRKVSRFSYQRAFVESYNFTTYPNDYISFDCNNFVLAQEVKGGIVINRGTTYPDYELVLSAEIESGVCKLMDIEPLLQVQMIEAGLKIFPIAEWDADPSGYISRLEYKKNDIGECINSGEYRLYDFKVSQTGFIKLSCIAHEPSQVYVVFEELNVNADSSKTADIRFARNNCLNIVEYQIAKGEFVHSSFEPYTAKFVKIIVKSGKISDVNVSIYTYENSDTKRFLFNCVDEKLNLVVEAARRTFIQNSVDILTDCPSRERGGWLCDSYFLARAEQLFTGKNLVEYDFLENYALYTKIENIPSGMIPMCYPADFEKESYIPNWAMWYMIELYDYFLRTEDRTLIEKSKPKVYELIEFFKKYINSDGLLENLENWVFIEWSRANDSEFTAGINFPSNMLYAKALKSAGLLYNDSMLVQRAEKMIEVIRLKSFNGEFFEDNSIRKDDNATLIGHTTETCQYYAFFCDVATPTLYPELYKKLISKFGAKRNTESIYPLVYKSNAFIGNYLRLMMLVQNGSKQLIAKECVDFFYKMAIRTGTLWENDDIYGSLNHGFASYAANLIVDYICGFKGFNGKIVYFSAPATDIDCALTLPLPGGEIYYNRKGNKEEIKVPEGYTVKIF